MYNRKWSLFLASLVAQSYLWCVYIIYIYMCMRAFYRGASVCSARVVHYLMVCLCLSLLSPSLCICVRVDIVCMHTTHTHTHTALRERERETRRTTTTLAPRQHKAGPLPRI